MTLGDNDAKTELFDADKPSRATRYAIALAATATATGINFLLKTPLDQGTPPYFFFSAAVLFSAFLGGIGPGLVATFLSVFVSNFFFISPIHSFLVDRPDQFYRLALFALEGMFISFLTAWLSSEKRQLLKSVWLRSAAGIGAVALAVAIKLPFYPRLDADVPFVMFYAAVMFAAWAGGLTGGLLATVLAAVAADFFFTEPYYSLKINNIDHAVRVGLFLIEGSLISYFSTRAYSARQAAQTARRERISALLESERHHRHLIERAADIVTVFDTNGTVLYVSPATTRLTGFPPEEVVGRNTIEDFVHPEDRERIWQIFKKGLAQNSQTETVEYRHRFKNGGWRTFESTGSNLIDDPLIGGIVVNTRDITEYNEKVKLLRESEERFRLAMLATSDAVWEWNLATNDVWRADNYGNLFGYSSDRVVSQIDWWFAKIHPEDRERVRTKIYQAIQSNAQTWRDEYRFAYESADTDKMFGDKVSESRFCEVVDRGYIARDKAGTAKRFIGAISDISESKAAENLRARLASIVESSPDGIKILDRDGVILDCNTSATTLFGYSKEEIVGRHCELFLPQKNRDTARRTLRDLLELVYAGETIVDAEMIGERKDKSLIEVSITLSPIRNMANEVTGIAAVNRDMTLRKQTETALFETQEQLRQAQKMEAIGRLAGGVAHDFNNMLSIIIGYSEIALQKISDTDQTRRYLEAIEYAGTRATELTRQLLAFSRKQLLQPRILNLNEIVRGTEGMLQRLIGAHIELKTALNEDVWLTVIDAGQIEQAIINLVTNARDAMPSGGIITIGTQNILLDADKSRLSKDVAAIPSGEYVSLFVSDTGAGMDEETRNKIFEPFFTTKKIGDGTGLGLSTVYGIIKQSNGYIAVESVLEKGTIFQIYLPRVAADNSEIQVSRAVEEKFVQGTETILIVEDEDALREIVGEFFSENGYTVLTAANGAAALTICEQTTAEIALVITDLQMPGMSGREFADRVIVQHPNLRVLFMSGFTDDLAFYKSAAESTVRFIQKPFALTDLAKCVRDILKVD